MSVLNDQQREAVEHVDGPLLVVAGPGTGKTQLLSLRAANILATRDVRPQSLLCLTYTDAGAMAMRRRLVELVGRNAYGIEVSTFHSFALKVRTGHPEFFRGGTTTKQVSNLYAKEVVDSYLKRLPFGSPLSFVHDGAASNLGNVISFIGRSKRSGLTPDDCRAIMRQNIACAEYLDGCDELMAIVSTDVGKHPGFSSGAELTARFEELVHQAHALAPAELKRPVVATAGVYVPYITWLDRLVSRTQLYEGRSTKGYQNVRDDEFKRGDDKVRRASVRTTSMQALVACDAYEHYQRTLENEGLIDYDDMVMDCLEAVASNPSLRYELQDRYRYIQVDEFQDTNGSQMRMVDLLCEGIEHPNVMAVGDDDQAIMRFQGASVAYIEQFQERYHPHVVVLATNYRSTPQIVSLGMGIAEQVEHRLTASSSGKRIRAHRTPSDQTSFCEKTFPTKELEYQALARDIRRRIDEGFVESCANPDDAIAVISAKHAGLRALIPFLAREGVPFTYKVKQNVQEMEPMQALLAALRFVVAYSQGRLELAESYLPQVVAAPEFGGDHFSSVAVALSARREHKDRWIEALASSHDSRLSGLRDKLVAWADKAPAAPVRELLFEVAAMPVAYWRQKRETNPYACAELNAGIRALLRFAEGELGTAACLGRTLRLADVIERLDQAVRLDVDLDATVTLGTPGAVRLTTVHSSKGLEYDLVYLLDADDATWHKTARGANLYPSNVLFGDKSDGDDARRLLFVAVTRARSYLELYRADGTMLREFDAADASEGAIQSVEGEFDEEDLADAIQTDWRGSYAIDSPELLTLVGERPVEHLSATSLNRFVKYEDGNPACARFCEEEVLRLPEAPSIALEFGSVVHAYLEDYVDHAIANGEDPLALASLWGEEVRRMDFREEDVAQYVERFDRIAATFGPWVSGRMDGRVMTEAPLTAVVGDNVPLFGKCDLLIVDDDARTVRVVDYKTGSDYPDGRPEPDYERQLRFYRLLVENSPEFEGYRVVTCENWYVEPEKQTAEMREPVVASVTDEEVGELTELIDAVWHRICASDFDTSAFEDSQLKEEALVGVRCKKDKKRALQAAYERWLVEMDA